MAAIKICLRWYSSGSLMMPFYRGLPGSLIGPLFQALKYYADYYHAILPFDGKYVLATFNGVTSDFGRVIEKVNQKFGARFSLFARTEENQKKCFQGLNA